MYNHKQLEAFIDNVHKEASNEAQKVYDKYNSELLKRIQNQISKTDRVCVNMGACSIDNKKGRDIAEKMGNVIARTMYWSENLEAGFSLPYLFTKDKIIDD